MIRRLIIILVALLNISLASAFADQTISTTTIKTNDQRIGIDIPADLAPGYHSVAVEATDPLTGEKSIENLTFCKDLEGAIHWASSCGVITSLATQKILEKTKVRNELPAYDPVSQPKKNLEVQIAAFATLSVLAAGGATGAFGNLGTLTLDAYTLARERPFARREELDDAPAVVPESERKNHGLQELESVESEHLKRFERKEGRGDQTSIWKTPLTQILDSIFIAGAHRTSRISPFVSRIFYDGNYLRAMFGSIAAVVHPLGIILGVLALKSVNAQALPPPWYLFSAIMVLGVFDAFSGFLVATTFSLGVLVAGNIGSRDELLTVVGTIAIFFAPALIASAFRPLRREIKNTADKWERLSDYLLAAVLTGWSVSKMVGSLTGLAGIQLPITFYAFSIGIVAAVAVLLRITGEDCATYLFPVRLASLHPTLSHPNKVQLSISILLKTIVFAFLAEPFIGNSIQLLLGILLFALPKMIAVTSSHKFPKSSAIHRAMPKGALKIVIMVFVGTIFGRWVQSFYQDPTEFLKWGFVILGMPGLVLQLFGFFADRSAPMNWKNTGKGRLLYQYGGALIFLLIVEIALGKNLVDLLLGP